MTETPAPPVLDGRPPLALVRALNPIMRVMLTTPMGRLVTPFALLEFTTRKSGRRLKVPVGWHEGINGRVVLTPAPWRPNFAGGLPVDVTYRGRTTHMVGTLDADLDSIAAELQAMFDRGIKPGTVGLKVAPGHSITAEDVRSVDRRLIRFVPSQTMREVRSPQ